MHRKHPRGLKKTSSSTRQLMIQIPHLQHLIIITLISKPLKTLDLQGKSTTVDQLYCETAQTDVRFAIS